MGNFLVSITARVATLTIISIVVVTFTAAQQNDRQLVQNATPTVTNGKRIALVIGNGAYATAPPLKNPPNDARDMAAALKTLGFDVSSGVNLTQREMKQLIREFGTRTAPGQIANQPNAANSLEGTIWKGDSNGGDKHYEFQFLPNGQVIEYLKMHESLTNKGTWYRNGNAVHMEFPDYYPVEATVEGNRMAGSWKSGAYKFTLKRVQ